MVRRMPEYANVSECPLCTEREISALGPLPGIIRCRDCGSIGITHLILMGATYGNVDYAITDGILVTFPKDQTFVGDIIIT